MESWYHGSMKKSFTAQYKAKVAIEAIQGIKSLSELSSIYDVHPTQIGVWKKEALNALPSLFADKRTKDNKTQQRLIDELYKTIGQRDIELQWMKKNIQLVDT
jgi:transposase-like protein